MASASSRAAVVEVGLRGHHHAAGAEAALGGVVVHPGLLDRRQLERRAETLDGRAPRRPRAAAERQQAAAPRLAVDEHGAGAAAAVLAARPSGS